MSDDINPNDLDRYFNDPNYRNSMKDNGKRSSKEKTGSRKRRFTMFADHPPFPWKWLAKWVGILLVICLIGGGILLMYLIQGMPSIQELENPKTDIASVVRSRDGVILDKYFTENRTYVPLDEISPHVIHALIATEDHRFYEHWGIDMYRTLSIPYHLIQGDVQGGSTITQQLARNLYKKIGREFSITRKLREMLTAIQIERHYTKREILEMYLNTVEFSNSSYGIETAAQTHFGKSAKDLNILEAATLVGTLNAVTAYNPRIHPERSRQRRNIVLYQMAKHGFITHQQLENLRSEPIVLDYHPPLTSSHKSRYFGEYVRQKVQAWADSNGYNLYRDGLTIYTTIDSRMQKYAEVALREKLDSIQTIYEHEWTSPGGKYMDIFRKKHPEFVDQFIQGTDIYKQALADGNRTPKEVLDSLKMHEAFVDSVLRDRARLEAGFVAIDPKNGHILAWVGGSNYGKVQFDHVYQMRRQPGSTFKPFVYTVAIDNGYSPYQRLSVYPIRFYGSDGKIWAPADFEPPTGPPTATLAEGLARSLNNVTVRLLPELAGAPGTHRLEDLIPAAKKIVNLAHRMGIRSPLRPFPSIALGTDPVSLLELTSAYTTFANMGVHYDPMAITRIEDKNGNVLAEYHSKFDKEAISPETAYTMIDMMRGVVRGVPPDGLGTGIRLRIVYHISQDVAAKTGTSQNSADNWFEAMTPNIVMGAWVGGEDRRIRFPENTYIGQGARTALPIVGDFMDKCIADPSVPWSYDAFEQPKGYIPPTPPQNQEASNPKNEKKGKIGW
ncbi:MAG TPA: transglycosylase domain-containing protein [Balneolales bacterium]|nr:transglycosylase domain-containing protein [Balneolales bacterium]